MQDDIKKTLSECQIYLENGDYDRLIESLRKLQKVDFSTLSEQEAKEAYKTVTFLIEKAEERRNEIAQKLVNFKRFKGYLRSG